MVQSLNIMKFFQNSQGGTEEKMSGTIKNVVSIRFNLVGEDPLFRIQKIQLDKKKNIRKDFSKNSSL